MGCSFPTPATGPSVEIHQAYQDSQIIFKLVLSLGAYLFQLYKFITSSYTDLCFIFQSESQMKPRIWAMGKPNPQLSLLIMSITLCLVSFQDQEYRPQTHKVERARYWNVMNSLQCLNLVYCEAASK